MPPTTLEAALRERIAQAQHGERLPTVRALMKAHGVGQATIQAVLTRLATQGLLSLQVGRGTFVLKPSALRREGLRAASVLLLSPRQQSERSHGVARRLQAHFADDGARCVQIVYERIDEALDLLAPDRRFDGCVLQSYFDPLPLGLLAFLRQRTQALCVDGARLAGVDVDAVASDWRGAMDEALQRLRAAGHQRIGFVAWPGPVQPLEGLRQHFRSLRRCLGLDEAAMPLYELGSLPRPGAPADADLQAVLARVPAARRGGPTALMVWGASVSALALREAMARPQAPHTVLLCHVNRHEEHLEAFDRVGSDSDQAADEIAAMVRWRLAHPMEEPRTAVLPSRWATAAAPVAAPRRLRKRD